MDKQEIRQFMFKKRLKNQALFKHDETILHKVLAHPKYHNAKCIALYVSLPQEVDTHVLLKNILTKKRVCVPKVHGEVMEFYEINSLNDLKKGCFGVLEPTTDKVVQPFEIDLMIVPLVAYDAALNRVGYGKGYYDRYMARCDCYKMGLAYTYQKVKQINVNCFDIRLDEIINEND